MGLWPITTTPAPAQEREESQQGLGNIDNSSNEVNSKKNNINDYSANLNMISLHINTLASSGVLLFGLIVFIVLVRFILRGGFSKMISRILALDCLQLCSCRGQPSPGPPEVPNQEQEPPPAYTPPEVGPGDQGQVEQQEGSGVSLSNTSLNDIRSAQQSLLDEMVELKSSLKYSKKLSETTIGSIRGMRAEVKDMRDLCRETISESRQTMRQRLMMPPHPTPVGRVYPRVPAPTENSEYLQEFFNQLLSGDQEVPTGFEYSSDTSEPSESVSLNIQ